MNEAELRRKADVAELLLHAARQLGESLDPERVYDRFHELLADVIQHDGVVVSSYDAVDDLIRCDYASVEGNRLDPAIFPPVPLNREGGGMQSRVIVSGEPLLVNDVVDRVQEPGGTYYDVDREGTVRKLPDEGPAKTRAAMMVPVKHEGAVVGVVQLMSDRQEYTPEHLELVEGLVAQMAAAVRNARLQKERRRLEAAEAAARAVATEREQAAQVLEAVGDGTFLLDDEGRVRLWNRAAELVTGRRRDGLVGRSIDEVFPGWDAVIDRIPVAERGAAARSVTLPLDVAGRELWLSFVAVRSAAGVVYAFRDLTAERRLEEAKDDFIATVSHELRTPMAAVLGAAQTLLRRDIELGPDQARMLLEMIASQGVRLSQITEDILLASRLDRGELPIGTERVPVDELVASTVAAMRARLPGNVELEVDVAPSVGAAVGDRDKLEQVLVNLIDNAIKYSPRGGTVTVCATRDDGTVRVRVVDEGIGIAPVEQARVFEKFYRVDPQLAKSPSGSGLGLYISRELVRRMGGSLGVESEPGVGSTFVVDLVASQS